MGNQQWVHLIIILLVLSMSALSWLYRQFKAYQAKQELKAAADRRREQMLRTGRAEQPSVGIPTGGGNVHDDARRKLMELAARRQAQLEEMARRAAGGQAARPPSRTAAPPPTPKTLRPATLAPPPQRPVARPTRPSQTSHPQRPQVPSAPPRSPAAAQRQRQAELEEARRRQESRSQAEDVRLKAEREQAARQKARTDALEARGNAEYTKATGTPSIAASEITDAPAADHVVATHRPELAAALAGLRVGTANPKATADAWRRAVIMTEILRPSVALREPDRG